MDVIVRDDAAAFRERWPNHAVPLPPIPPRVMNSGTFDAPYEYQKIVERVENGAYRLRVPARHFAGLAGPFFPIGWCLTGIWGDKDLWFFDANIPATDGDLVMIEWSAARMVEMSSSAKDERYRATYLPDGISSNVACKILRFRAGHPAALFTLSDREGGVVLPLVDEARRARFRVLAVLRYVLRGADVKLGPRPGTVRLRGGIPLWGSGDPLQRE